MKLAVVPITEPIARAAAMYKSAAKMAGVEATIDAIVVAASAAAGGGVALTSDGRDIRRLAQRVPAVRIRSVVV